MRMVDVNVLVDAHRKESPHHAEAAAYLRGLVEGDEPFALSEAVVQGFVRLVTNPKLFRPATELGQAFEFVEQIEAQPHCFRVRPGVAHRRIFEELCRWVKARGPLVTDAAHAALAVESGCVWVTRDADFARFAPRLRVELL